MRKAFSIVPILAVTALLAACGSGGSSAPLATNDVAVVGDQHITTTDFTQEIDQAKESYAQSGQAFPKAGTAAYAAIKSQAITLLLQSAEREAKAKSLGITVTDKQVDAKLVALKKQYFGGSEAKYQAQLKKQHLTDALVRKDLRQQLVEQKLYNQVTKGVTVSKADINSYYEQNQSQYEQAPSRAVQYILVKQHSLADQIYAQVKGGSATAWCTLAKKYSQDPSSKNTCGKATFTQGQTVAAFDKVLFSEKTGVTHEPVYDPQQYKSWFVIRPTAAATPQKLTPVAKVSASIKQTLLQKAQSDAVTAWTATLQKQFCKGSQIKYQVGYTPSPDPCAPAASTTTT